LDPHFFVDRYGTIRLKEKTMVTKGTGMKHDLVRPDAVWTDMGEIQPAQFFGKPYYTSEKIQQMDLGKKVANGSKSGKKRGATSLRYPFISG
jgi:hypothetical protein